LRKGVDNPQVARKIKATVGGYKKTERLGIKRRRGKQGVWKRVLHLLKNLYLSRLTAGVGKEGLQSTPRVGILVIRHGVSEGGCSVCWERMGHEQA